MATEDVIAEALMEVAHELRWLGNADASTPFGALEAYGIVVEEAAKTQADGLHDIADAIRDLCERIPPGPRPMSSL